MKPKQPKEYKKGYGNQPQLSDSGEPVKLHKATALRGVEIYTDGACENNPGTGGYAFIVMENGKQVHQYSQGPVTNTTNNRMELMAIKDALCWVLSETAEPVTLYTDSQYCQKGITQWMQSWAKKNWKDVLNSDIWKELYLLVAEVPNVQVKWIRGHSGIEGNELADKLAVRACTGCYKEDIQTYKPSKKVEVNQEESAISLLTEVYNKIGEFLKNKNLPG